MFLTNRDFYVIHPLHGKTLYTPYPYQANLVGRILKNKNNVILSAPSMGISTTFDILAAEQMYFGKKTIIVTHGRYRTSMHADSVNDPKFGRVKNAVRDTLSGGEVRWIACQDISTLRGFRIYDITHVVIDIGNNGIHKVINDLKILGLSGDVKFSIVGRGGGNEHDDVRQLYENASQRGFKASTIRAYLHPEFNKHWAYDRIRYTGMNGYRNMYECRLINR